MTDAVPPPDPGIRAGDALVDDERRLLSLHGVRNFRDLGGYRTQDGRRVKWGKLFRSGSMAGLASSDHDGLARLSIRTIIDLRTAYERQAEPNTWHLAAKITCWSGDCHNSFGELRKVLASGLPSAAAARDAMIEGYRRLPFEQAPAFTELFGRLAAGDVPLIVHCSAGKDRTGIAAALVLSALGVARDTVVEDYVLTNKVADLERHHLQRARQRKSALADQSPEIISAVMSAHADYLYAAFAVMEERYGTIGGYLREQANVTPETLHRIQRALLE